MTIEGQTIYGHPMTLALPTEIAAPFERFHLLIRVDEFDTIGRIFIQLNSPNHEPTSMWWLGAFAVYTLDEPIIHTGELLIETSTIAKDVGSDHASWSASTVLGAQASNIGASESTPAFEGASALAVDGDPANVNEWVQVDRTYSPASEEIDISTSDIVLVWVKVDQGVIDGTPGGEVFFGFAVKDGATTHTYDEVMLNQGGWNLVMYEVAAATGVTSIDRVTVGLRGGDQPGLAFEVDTIRVGTLYDAVDRTEEILGV